MFEVVKAIGKAMDGFEEVSPSFEGLDAGWIEGESPVTVGDGVGGAAGGAEGGGTVEEALGEEGLRGGAAAVEDFGEEADGLGGKAGIEGGESGGATSEEELYVAEEGGCGVGFGGGSRRDREIGECEAVVGTAGAFTARSGGGEAFSGL